METRVDPWGRVIVDLPAAEEILLSGVSLDDLLVDPSAAVEQFNALCRINDMPRLQLRTPEPLDHSPEEEHARRSATWLICEELRDLDVREFILSLCTTDEQRQRVNEEMDLYEARDLAPLLRTMICLVDHFRRNGIVWGVGRGSSVASYVLYKIGVHKIDSLRYGLSVREFLKD